MLTPVLAKHSKSFSLIDCVSEGTGGTITNAHFYDISNRYPAGGFDASAEDLLRFVIAVGSGKVLKPETVKQMWTAQPTADGAKTVFGLGWGVSVSVMLSMSDRNAF